MKCFIFLVLIVLSELGFSQNSTSVSHPLSNLYSNSKLNLNQYVWSQTHIASESNKLVLDYDVIDDWEHFNDIKLSISSDGRYFAYSTFRRSGSFSKKDETLIVKSCTDSWQKSFSGANAGFFSLDSKQYVFISNGDLYFFRTNSDSIRCVKSISSHKQSSNGNSEWLAYQLKDKDATLVLENLVSGKEVRFTNVGTSRYGFDNASRWLACQLINEKKELVLYNLYTGKQQYFEYVADYVWDQQGNTLLVKTIKKLSDKYLTSLQFINLSNGDIKTIWSTTDSSSNISDYAVHGSSGQVIFKLSQGYSSGTGVKNKLSDNSILFWRTGMDKALVKVNNKTSGIKQGFLIEGAPSFTEDGRYILFLLKEVPNFQEPVKDAAKLNIWSYRDMILQSTQSFLLKRPSNAYTAIINPQEDKVISLERENEKLCLMKGDFAVIKKSNQELTDRYWEKDYKKDSNWLVSLKDGSRQLLPTNIAEDMLWFSPGGSYLVYLDGEHGCHYFSLDLHTRKAIKISTGILDWQLGIVNYFLRGGSKPTQGVGIAGWLKADGGLLVYDSYDIWQLDLTGRKPPVNITNGYGRKHKTLLSLINKQRLYASDLVFQEGDTLQLAAFSRLNKYSGFFRKILGVSGNPERLIMGPYHFQLLRPLDGFSNGMQPVRASNANAWIVQRQSATEAPNYFFTNDFKTFKPLTNLQPHRRYNWLTTELHSFKQLDGTTSTGVLYKPENFDPRKKYPVIISFYEDMSSRLYQFPTPGYVNNASIFDAPAWMVSHDYLVFLPDIYFNKGQWGPSTVNTVVGAAKFLSHFPFVDVKHMGACGHSNSGRFGYYLFTHSQCFSAMSVGSGTTDIISNGLSMRGDKDGSKLEWAEIGSFGTALGNLWENKNVWLDHSAVLQADKVTTPILMFQNKNDRSFSQGEAMFNSLWRLQKVAWWLQYDQGGHTLDFLQDRKDFTIRYTQFFDHYLKEAPAPKWMTQGVSVAKKGIEFGLDLDPSGNCSNECKICNRWNDQVKRDSAMFTKPIGEWKLETAQYRKSLQVSPVKVVTKSK